MSLFVKVQNAVRKYKATRIKHAINEYFNMVGISIREDAPVILAIYNNIARDVVDLTERDAQPLLDFVSASERLIAHYGPTIKGQIAAGSEVLNEHSPELITQMKRMAAAWSAVQADLRTESEATRTPVRDATAASEPAVA